jgi:hypothetical protein
MLLGVLLILVMCGRGLSEVVNVPLYKEDYTWYADIELENATTSSVTSYRAVVDLSTTYSVFVVTDQAFQVYSESGDYVGVHSCPSLSIDTTSAEFSRSDNDDSRRCVTVQGNISMSSIKTTYPVILAEQVSTENAGLHTWADNSQGLLGLAYVGGYSPTPDATEDAYGSFFRQTLAQTGSQVFGLDFNADGENSAMTLGGYNPAYDVVWQRQPVSNPSSHEAMVDDMTMCGVKLYSNWTSSWPVLFDSSASCLALPVEVYEVFETWLDTSSLVNYDDDGTLVAPTLTFNLAGNASKLHIRLSDLLVDEGVIDQETAPPALPDGRRLCVVNSGSHVQYNDARNYGWPTIVMGSLAMQSLYFAADFDTQRLGLASKGNFPSDTDILASGGCAAAAVCIGQEKWDRTTNTCMAPPCKDYFFVDRDEDTMQCVWRSGAMGVGIFAVIVVLLAETTTYFVRGFTGSTITGSRVDLLTYHIGKTLSTLVDKAVVYLDMVEAPLAPGLEEE